MGKRHAHPTKEEQLSLVPSERKRAKSAAQDPDARFIGKPIPAAEAQKKWPERYRYKLKNKVQKRDLLRSPNGEQSEENGVFQALCHYSQAEVDGIKYNLNDDAYVKVEDGKPNYIARIIELFETVDKEQYFTA